VSPVRFHNLRSRTSSTFRACKRKQRPEHALNLPEILAALSIVLAWTFQTVLSPITLGPRLTQSANSAAPAAARYVCSIQQYQRHRN